MQGLVSQPDRLGRGPLLVGLMAGAGLGAVQELLRQGEDPGQEDEVGRGCPEAAILYCQPPVIEATLAACRTGDTQVGRNLPFLVSGLQLAGASLPFSEL